MGDLTEFVKKRKTDYENAKQKIIISSCQQ